MSSSANQPPESPAKRQLTGRGSALQLKNRFEKIELESTFDQLEPEDVHLVGKIKTEYYDDDANTVVSENQSPDVDFRYSLNPYRGCVHGCSYCYARPTHEYLGLNAGIDFESKIFVKPQAATLFRKWLSRKKWRDQVEPVMLSGVTDCYQPCERELKLTRQCLEVALEHGQPMRITTKNTLVTRDIDLLEKLAAKNLVVVTISVGTLDQSLVRVMEPRSSSPQARLNAIEQLSSVGVPIKVLVAPIIPGLNDAEIPSVLGTVAERGASRAGYVMLRLPLAVEPVFVDWLETHMPDAKEKILGRVRALRGGKLYDSDFSQRMKGTGIWAQQIESLFKLHLKKSGLKSGTPQLDCDRFQVPEVDDGQGRLF